MARRRQRTKTRHSRTLRVRRSLGLDRNPLRRSIDRLEAWVRCTLVVLFLTCGPLVAALVAHSVESAAQLAGRTQAALHRVTARVLKEMPPAKGCANWPCEQIDVLASWTTPAGLVRTGLIPVTGAVNVGSSLAVWLNDRGQPVGPPTSRSWAVSEATAAGVGTLGAVALICLFSATGTARALQRRKLAHWEADWLVIGPRWTKRH
jgi:hypothetical protein